MTATEPEPQGSKTSLSLDVLTPLPLPIETLVEQIRWFERFKRDVLSPNDTQQINNKPFIKRSGTRKLALAFGVSDELVSSRRVPAEGRDKDGNFYYETVTRAFHAPTGRTSIGVAIASWNEKKSWPHGEHDVLTLSHTRSKSRAVLDLVGGGELSAEELVADESTKTVGEITGEALDRLPWKAMAKNPNGSWVYSNLPEAAGLVDALSKAPEKTLTVGPYTYTISGADGKFVNRFPHKDEARG